MKYPHFTISASAVFLAASNAWLHHIIPPPHDLEYQGCGSWTARLWSSSSTTITTFPCTLFFPTHGVRTKSLFSRSVAHESRSSPMPDSSRFRNVAPRPQPMASSTYGSTLVVLTRRIARSYQRLSTRCSIGTETRQNAISIWRTLRASTTCIRVDDLRGDGLCRN